MNEQRGEALLHSREITRQHFFTDSVRPKPSFESETRQVVAKSENRENVISHEDGAIRPPYSPDLWPSTLMKPLYALSQDVDRVKDWGRFLTGLSKILMHSINALIEIIPAAVVTTIFALIYFWKTAGSIAAAAAAGISAPFVVLGAAGIGALLGGLHYFFVTLDDGRNINRIGFGPWIRKNRPNTLGEARATRWQLKHIIMRFAKLVTKNKYEKLGYKYEREDGKDDGFCSLESNGQIFVVLNKGEWWFSKKKDKQKKDNDFYKKSSRDPYSLAHELGHALEFFAYRSTGHLSRFHEKNPEMIKQMLQAVLSGLPHSWFHDNSPPGQPHKLDAEIAKAEAMERAHEEFINGDKKNAKRPPLPEVSSESLREKRKYHQSKWSYAELFAEVMALYLTRPDWFKSHYPDAALFFANFVNDSPMVKHLHLA